MGIIGGRAPAHWTNSLNKIMNAAAKQLCSCTYSIIYFTNKYMIFQSNKSYNIPKFHPRSKIGKLPNKVRYFVAK